MGRYRDPQLQIGENYSNLSDIHWDQEFKNPVIGIRQKDSGKLVATDQYASAHNHLIFPREPILSQKAMRQTRDMDRMLN